MQHSRPFGKVHAVLSPRISARVQDAIERHNLHATVPVDISSWAESEGWDVRISSRLNVLRGFAVVIETVKIMAINANMDTAWQRAAIAHEAAHVLAEHTDTLHTMRRNQHWNLKQESDADRIAAYLLIPDWVLMEYETAAEVADACDVPLELVELRVQRIREMT